ncbi:hypothetical protein [Actinoplanes sp. G11-F43]|uniref:hypothetical protein n=1 Tax=Actinoplanes sp. G11-F43 TaxID=3424130 RepID=UPI003D34D0BC
MKRWLRAGGEVEFADHGESDWKMVLYRERTEHISLLKELLVGNGMDPTLINDLEIAPGRWFLPGTPP